MNVKAVEGLLITYHLRMLFLTKRDFLSPIPSSLSTDFSIFYICEKLFLHFQPKMAIN